MSRDYIIAVITNDIYTREDAEFITRRRYNHPRSETCFASLPNISSLNKEGKIGQSLR
ncbi:MAG: hypothetical protein ABIQ00_13145 [Chitinophagaceae bacterium]